MKGLDTVESLSVEAKGSKVANFTVLVTLLPTFVISSSVGGTKSRASPHKCGQNISSTVAVTKSRAFPHKCGQNCANLLCRNNISRASPENKKGLTPVSVSIQAHCQLKFLLNVRYNSYSDS